jgi:hypothetical protein
VKVFEVEAKETCTRLYAVPAKDEEEARRKVNEGESMLSFKEVDAEIEEIVSVKELK